MKIVSPIVMMFYLLVIASQTCLADDANTIYPAAIFDFVEKSGHLSGTGEKVATVIFAQLATDPNISLVDREELSKLEDEATLSLSGMVNTQQANQIGQLTGAKIIVTGSVFEIDKSFMIVAKIIGAETSRVLGASVKGNVNDNIVNLTEALSAKIADTIKSKSDQLVAKAVKREDRIAALKDQLKSADKPIVKVTIAEHHINRAASDPAAETEMVYYCLETGFDVVAAEAEKNRQADVLITGEGFTEFATRKGSLVAVKARLEVKAVDGASGRVMAIDRQTEQEVDLSEIIAGKKALQRASAKIAERILPKIVPQ